METATVEEFRMAAEEFCGLAEAGRPLGAGDLWVIRGLLLRLLLNIPAVEAHPQGVETAGRRPGESEFGRAVRRFAELPFSFYRVVFDPHDLEADDEPVMGMLADDLADIFRDLVVGLDQARNGNLEAACFDWCLSYRTHWARHAVHALTAMELYRTGDSGGSVPGTGG
jgi:hypothetical protein